MKDYYYQDLAKLRQFVRPTYAWMNTVANMVDVQRELARLRRRANPSDRLLITYYNHLWEPLLKLASLLGWRRSVGEQNWLDNQDLKNLCELTGWDVITIQHRLLLPVNIPLLSNLVTRYLAPLPLINPLCLTTWLVARPKPVRSNDYSVSIIIPARNEAGNISKIVNSIPRFGKWQEIIFVEGHSQDETWSLIQKVKTRAAGIASGDARQKPKVKILAYKQKGVGKADAVRLGFSKASGDVLMILDADLTVDPQELTKFYQAIARGDGEFINGSRLVYPMAKDAMRTLNKLANKIFGWLFTRILGQRFKDTLCGTKALLRRDYLRFNRDKKFLGKLDPFGDFDLLFGAVKHQLKIVEIPVRYKRRVYGRTNINRFRHGWLLAQMTWTSFKLFKAW